MTVVFVHGVPETPVVWDVVRERLDVDSVALALPGFGSPRPEHLRDNHDYATWLGDRLAAIPGPIDLVAHDWGAHLAIRVVSLGQVDIRTWVTDAAEAWHPDHVWHEGAQVIQSPQGREFLASLVAPDGSFETFLRPRGINEATMADIDRVADEVMTGAMYDLYRDATPNLFHYRGWGPQMEAARAVPGLIVAGEKDPYGDLQLSRQTAERLGAQFVALPDRSHYWMHQDPDAAAALLLGFWAGRT